MTSPVGSEAPDFMASQATSGVVIAAGIAHMGNNVAVSPVNNLPVAGFGSLYVAVQNHPAANLELAVDITVERSDGSGRNMALRRLYDIPAMSKLAGPLWRWARILPALGAQAFMTLSQGPAGGNADLNYTIIALLGVLGDRPVWDDDTAGVSTIGGTVLAFTNSAIAAGGNVTTFLTSSYDGPAQLSIQSPIASVITAQVTSVDRTDTVVGRIRVNAPNSDLVAPVLLPRACYHQLVVTNTDGVAHTPTVTLLAAPTF